jgi:hypothetical protein
MSKNVIFVTKLALWSVSYTDFCTKTELCDDDYYVTSGHRNNTNNN